MENIIKKKSIYRETNPEGKITIFDDTQVKIKDIYGYFKEFGIAKDRLELCL